VFIVHYGIFTALPSTLLGGTTIATLAIELDLELWNHDHHFTHIQTVLPQLKLFKEPP